VEIANVEAALGRVHSFIALLEQNHDIWNATESGTVNPQLRHSDNQVHEQLPLVWQIAARADTDLQAKLEKGMTEGSYGWRYHGVLQASRKAGRRAKITMAAHPAVLAGFWPHCSAQRRHLLRIVAEQHLTRSAIIWTGSACACRSLRIRRLGVRVPPSAPRSDAVYSSPQDTPAVLYSNDSCRTRRVSGGSEVACLACLAGMPGVPSLT
jgi:hypothetical protein